MSDDEGTETTGAAEDDTTTEDQGAGNSGGDAGKDGDGKGNTGKGGTWTPPTEAEWKAEREKLKKANGQAAAHRKEADELRRKGESETEAKAREAREQASAEAEKTWKPRYVKQAAKAGLATAGLVGSPDRLLKLIDSDAVDIDDDGEVSGLDEQIRALKKDYPELFVKRGSGRIDGSDRGGDGGGGNGGGMSATSRRLLEQARS